MPLYRALDKLSGVCARGAVTPLAHLNETQVNALIKSGAVARVLSPPLAELPDWSSRAGKLKKLDIVTVEDFLCTDPAQIAETLRVKPETVAGYVTELTQWLVL